MKLDDAGIVDTQSTPVLSGQQTQVRKPRLYSFDEVLTMIESVCSDEDVHCDYSCHVCGGVKEFLTKLLALLEKEMK